MHQEDLVREAAGCDTYFATSYHLTPSRPTTGLAAPSITPFSSALTSGISSFRRAAERADQRDRTECPTLAVAVEADPLSMKVYPFLR